MKTLLLSRGLFGAMTLLPISVFAHTGIGETHGFGAGFSHPIGGADHLLAMLAVGLWSAQMGGRALWLLPGAFVALMLAGGGLAIAGIGLPFVEQAILLSVLVLGALIAAASRQPPSACTFIVGLFAVFHGHAHGAEMPLTSAAVSYSLGFASATILLHAAGVAAGIILNKFAIEKAVRWGGAAIALGGVYLAIV
ncbi:MAG: HupE/UreJ family protein [Gammaproteobacteria bacterium]